MCRYELSEKTLSACHTLKAHLCDGQTLSSRELVSATDDSVWTQLYVVYSAHQVAHGMYSMWYIQARHHIRFRVNVPDE